MSGRRARKATGGPSHATRARRAPETAEVEPPLWRRTDGGGLVEEACLAAVVVAVDGAGAVCGVQATSLLRLARAIPDRYDGALALGGFSASAGSHSIRNSWRLVPSI
eukprot:scaffold3099_cov100-Isochrysis_galbana.AAC.15